MLKVATNKFSSYELIRQRIYDSYPSDGPHGQQHVGSVAAFAKRLNEGNKVNPQTLELAALLHDVGHRVDGDHTLTGLGIAKQYLTPLTTLSKHDILSIEDAISNHMTSGIPTTDIGRIVADADRLSGINELPRRSLEFHTAKGRDEAKAYWHFRHNKIPRLKNKRSFHTSNGKALHDEEVQRMIEATGTLEGYRRLARNE